MDKTSGPISRPQAKRKDTAGALALRDITNVMPKQTIAQVQRNWDRGETGAAVKKIKTAMRSKISMNDVKNAAFLKMGVKNWKEFWNAMETQHVDMRGWSRKDLMIAVALDDWTSIWERIKEPLKNIGKASLKYLLQYGLRALGPTALIGGDEGFQSIDWPGSNNPAISPSRISLTPGVNVQQIGIKNAYNVAEVCNETVSGYSIAAVIAPELAKYRYAYIESARVSFGTPVTVVDVFTGSTGNVGFSVSPNQLGGNPIITYQNIDLTTGVATSATAFPLVISTVTAAFDGIRCSSNSIRWEPVASLNTAGALTFGYQYKSATPDATNIRTTLTSLQNWPYNTSVNIRTPVRMIGPTNDGVADEMNVYGAALYPTNRFVMLGSGLPVNTMIGRLTLTLNIEFNAAGNYIPICPADFPYPGPATETFESYMFTKFPILQSLDLQDAQRIATALVAGEKYNFSTLIEVIEQLLSGITPRLYTPHIHASTSQGAVFLGSGIPTESLRRNAPRVWNPEFIPNNNQNNGGD